MGAHGPFPAFSLHHERKKPALPTEVHVLYHMYVLVLYHARAAGTWWWNLEARKGDVYALYYSVFKDHANTGQSLPAGSQPGCGTREGYEGRC
jgi:hypothetical protein